MISFIIGLFVGSFLGVTTMALLAMAKDPEPPKREPEHKEPTILWTVGNLCMWKGKLCEIKKFSTTTDNQTVVQLIRKSPEHNYWIWVPIEEMEAVEE